MEAKQTPLIELLEQVPHDARVVVEHDQFSSSSHPVGRLCHEAAAALRERLAQTITDYWQEEARRYAQNAEYWRSEAEKAQHIIDCPRCGHCCPQPRQWQGLTDEEINSVRYKRDWTAPWTDTTFARYIESKIKEKNHG
jgi:hypothetical protein